MTALIRAFLFCDGRWPDGTECDSTLDYSTVPDARTAYEARAEAKFAGWHRRPGGRDICPGCWERGER